MSFSAEACSIHTKICNQVALRGGRGTVKILIKHHHYTTRHAKEMSLGQRVRRTCSISVRQLPIVSPACWLRAAPRCRRTVQCGGVEGGVQGHGVRGDIGNHFRKSRPIWRILVVMSFKTYYRGSFCYDQLLRISRNR